MKCYKCVSFLMFLVLYSFAYLQCMEDCIAYGYLLQPSTDNKENMENAGKEDPFPLFTLNQTSPYLVAHIFSFLSGNNRGLNYLIRMREFQPTSDSGEESPFFSIAKRIQEAHNDFFLKKCKTLCTNFAQDDPETQQAKTATLFTLMYSFMATTRHSNYKKNGFFWSNIHNLNYLFLPFCQDTAPLDPLAIQMGLGAYIAETEKQYQKTKIDLIKKEDHPYVGARLGILSALATKVLHNPYLYCAIVHNEKIYSCANCQNVGFMGGVSAIASSYATALLHILEAPAMLTCIFGGCTGCCLCVSCCGYSGYYAIKHYGKSQRKKTNKANVDTVLRSLDNAIKMLIQE